MRVGAGWDDVGVKWVLAGGLGGAPDGWGLLIRTPAGLCSMSLVQKIGRDTGVLSAATIGTIRLPSDKEMLAQVERMQPDLR